MSLIENVRRLVRQFTAHLDLFALYPAEVAGQNEDGTLELKPLHPRVAGVSRVPIRYGVPGVRAQVRRGSLVLLGFEAGDARVPYASLFAAESIDSLTVTASAKVVVKAPEIYLADEEGAQPLARVGDLVEVALPPLTPFTGTVVPAPPGSPVAGTLTFTETAQGYITSGSKYSGSK